MIKIKRALISVSDKTGILDLAKELNKFGVEILSTGGTAKILRENNIPAVNRRDRSAGRPRSRARVQRPPELKVQAWAKMFQLPSARVWA